MKKIKFIDLFCGIGGFHQAMKSLGGECVFASDIDDDCRKTYEANYGIAPVGDITKIDAADIPAHDVLCGGFPCQAFSKAGNWSIIILNMLCWRTFEISQVMIMVKHGV